MLWWHTPRIGRQRQANLCEFRASLGYLVNRCPKKNKTKKFLSAV